MLGGSNNDIVDESAGLCVCNSSPLGNAETKGWPPCTNRRFFNIVQKWGWGKTHVQKHCCKFYIVRTLVS